MLLNNGDGPRLLTLAAAMHIASGMPLPHNVSTKAPATISPIYRNTKAKTLWMYPSSTTTPSTFTRVTAPGCSIRVKYPPIYFHITITRLSFNPPPVEPAQAPVTIKTNVSALTISGNTPPVGNQYPQVDIVEAI